MKKTTLTCLMAITLAASSYTFAQSNDGGVMKKRMLWESHLTIHNDTSHTLLVYTGGTAMTYYPGAKFQPYYGLLSFAAQNVIIVDKKTDEVFYNKRVIDETYLHVTAYEAPTGTVYTVTPEKMH